MTSCIAVINAGSSSVKFAIYEATTEERCLFRGQIEGIGVAPRLSIADAKGGTVEDRAFPSRGFDHDAATRQILTAGAALIGEELVAGFGHRVVHGGLKYDAPVRVTESVVDDLTKLVPLAPLHQPHNLAPIRTIMKVAPEIPRSHASTPPSIAASPISPRRSHCRAGLPTRAFGVTGFTDCRTSISHRGSTSLRRNWRRGGSSWRIWATAPACAR